LRIDGDVVRRTPVAAPIFAEALAWERGGSALLVADREGLRRWSMRDGSLSPVKGAPEDVREVKALSRRDGFVVTSGRETLLVVGGVVTRRLAHPSSDEDGEAWVFELAVASDDSLVAAASTQGVVLWPLPLEE
jgi:hypothetical protein